MHRPLVRGPSKDSAYWQGILQMARARIELMRAKTSDVAGSIRNAGGRWRGPESN
jgi:hypothetical protein